MTQQLGFAEALVGVGLGRNRRFAGSRAEATIAARGGRARIVQNGAWGGPAALVRVQAHNAEVSRVRGRIEKVFGTCKRSYGRHRMR